MAFRTNKTPVLQEKTASGSVASFNTILQKPLVNGEFTIQAYQEGSGDPAPDNVRNIVGFNVINISHSDGVNTPVIYTKSLGETVYGGSYNSVTGKLILTHAREIKATSAFYTFDAHTGSPCSTAYINVSNDIKILDVYNTQSLIDAGFMSNKLKTHYGSYTQSAAINAIRPYSSSNRTRMLCTFDGSVITQASDIANVFGDTIQIQYPLQTPIEIQLTPEEIQTFNGANNIFCDTGDTSVVYNDLDIAKRGSFREVFKLPS